MRKILPILLIFFSISCLSEEAKAQLEKFDEVAYVKTDAKDRIQIYVIDYGKVTSDEVFQHTLGKMHTTGRLTAVYYFDKNDRYPKGSRFNGHKSFSTASLDLYNSSDIDDWKYVYVRGYPFNDLGYYDNLIDCTLPKESRLYGLCKGDK